MKRKRFTEEQIISLLKEAEAGVKTDDLARRHGISDPTILIETRMQGLSPTSSTFGCEPSCRVCQSSRF